MTDAERRLLHRFLAYLRGERLEVCTRRDPRVKQGWWPITGSGADLLGDFDRWRERQDAEQREFS